MVRGGRQPEEKVDEWQLDEMALARTEHDARLFEAQLVLVLRCSKCTCRRRGRRA